MNIIKKIFFSVSILAMIAAQSCGLLDKIDDPVPVTTTYTPSLQDTNQTFAVGKTVFNVVIKDQNGTATPGLTVEVDPEMDMGMMGTHGTPVESISDNGDGSYAVTAYFLMDGAWALHFHVNAEHLTDHLAITVGGSMMNRGRLNGVTDMTTYWMASHYRPYNIFKSSISAGTPGSDSIDLYLTTWESEINLPVVFMGQTLHTDSMDATTAWTVGTVQLDVCTIAGTWNNNGTASDPSDDTYTCGGWTTLTADTLNPGHYTGSALTIVDTKNPAGMSMSMGAQFAVRLNVGNSTTSTSEWKTTATDGTPGAGTENGTTELTHINQ